MTAFNRKTAPLDTELFMIHPNRHQREGRGDADWRADGHVLEPCELPTNLRSTGVRTGISVALEEGVNKASQLSSDRQGNRVT